MKKQTSLVFTGDIGFDRYMSKKWTDEELISDDILSFFSSAEHVIANVEGALINAEDDGSRGIYFHSMDPEAVCVLKRINSDIWNIANNHIMDAGEEGVVSTLGIAKENGCHTLGAGRNISEASKPVILDEAGGIGLISVGYDECVPATEVSAGSFNWGNFDLISERIAEIKSENRWCVVVVHGGEEFSAMPSPYIRERYIKYLSFGADIIVAHHPHVPQNYERFSDGKMIFYSLGNFIFDTDYQRAHRYTDTGVLLKLSFDENSFSFEGVGTKLIRGEQHIVLSKLPDIFTDVPERDYHTLIPFASKVFLEEEKRRMRFVDPEKYTDASDETWKEYFNGTDIEGYSKGELMDLALVSLYAEKYDEKKMSGCKLEKVKNYLLTLK